MKKYVLRRNFTGIALDQDQEIRGKLAFKTVEDGWLYTQSPVIILVSVHSRFHDGVEGDLKMNALISTIKSNVNGKITILFSDRAHLRTTSLDYQNDIDKAFNACFSSAEELCERYERYFERCKIAFWHSYICQDANFPFALDAVKALYQNDLQFRKTVYEDVEASYTQKGQKQYLDKSLFMQNGIDDLLEQCACLTVLAKRDIGISFIQERPTPVLNMLRSSLFHHRNKSPGSKSS